jgi:hypothetical protein
MYKQMTPIVIYDRAYPLIYNCDLFVIYQRSYISKAREREYAL